MEVHSAPARPGAGRAVVSHGDVRIAMRDGLQLHAVLHLPRIRAAGVPTVVELTPYVADGLHEDGVWFAEHGMAFLAVDVRGRGDSEGEFWPYVHDGEDGHDVLAWAAAQPWSDGRTMLFGGSYSGGNQFLVLATRPASLVAMTPAASAVSGLDVPQGGVPSLYDARWLQYVTGRAVNGGLAGDAAAWNADTLEAVRASTHLWPILERRGVQVTPWLRAAVEQPEFGPHWHEGYLPATESLEGAAVPVLSVTGWHDDALLGALFHHDRWRALAAPEAVGRSALLIGPWDHAGTHSGSNRVGDLSFAAAAELDLRELRYRWFRAVLDGRPLPEPLSAPVVYYLAGAERWLEAPSLAQATTGSLGLHLDATAGQSGCFASGRLTLRPPSAGEVSFACDPADTRTLELELLPREGLAPMNAIWTTPYHSLMQHAAGNDPTCESFALELTDQGAVFHTAPLDRELVLTGAPVLDLRLWLDQPDADLLVMLSVVLPTGGCVLLSSRVQRLSALADPPRPMPTDGPITVRIEGMRPHARALQPGARLRLVVRDAQSAMTPLRPGASRPGGDGGAPRVTVRVLTGPNGSVLHLPLGPPAKD